MTDLFIVIMPLDSNGIGPVPKSLASRITWEVWDINFDVLEIFESEAEAHSYVQSVANGYPGQSGVNYG